MVNRGKGLSSTIIYTSELILCSTICVPSATRHNIHMYPYFLFAAIHHLKSSPTFSGHKKQYNIINFSMGKLTLNECLCSWQPLLWSLNGEKINVGIEQWRSENLSRNAWFTSNPCFFTYRMTTDRGLTPLKWKCIETQFFSHEVAALTFPS